MGDATSGGVDLLARLRADDIVPPDLRDLLPAAIDPVEALDRLRELANHPLDIARLQEYPAVPIPIARYAVGRELATTHTYVDFAIPDLPALSASQDALVDTCRTHSRRLALPVSGRVAAVDVVQSEVGRHQIQRDKADTWHPDYDASPTDDALYWFWVANGIPPRATAQTFTFTPDEVAAWRADPIGAPLQAFSRQIDHSRTYRLEFDVLYVCPPEAIHAAVACSRDDIPPGADFVWRTSGRVAVAAPHSDHALN